jgi:allophanate hydrolase subunit 1
VVLTRGRGVLGFVPGFVLLAGCSESLFGAHRAGHGDDVPMACTSLCVADAAADFDGTAGGKGTTGDTSTIIATGRGRQ